MLVNFGARLCSLHELLRNFKDRKIAFFTRLLPANLTPNRITFIRFVIVVCCLCTLLFFETWWQALVYLFSYFLDLLDGALARARNMVTYYGEKFDAFTDRLGHIALYFTLWALCDYRLFTLFYFILTEIFFIFYLLFEYHRSSSALAFRRTALQFTAKVILWTFLLRELFLKF